MATRRISLTSAWQQVTDGSQSVLIQISGVIYLCDSEAQPERGAPVHTLTGFISVNPPVKAWVRSGPDSTATIIIT